MHIAVLAILALQGTDRFPGEEIYDTRVHPDEALVNVVLANHRWPDCTTNRTAIGDIFRIEGARTDTEKALALWKWFRILVSPTGGGYMLEGEVPGKEEIVYDPHKILTVYGHHMCDGQSWAMTALWRAAGYIAFDQCHSTHTIASLRYKDDDGQYRFHDFDPQKKFYYWDSRHNRVGTVTIPLMRGWVHRHLLAPQKVHTLRTSLRVGETLERRWESDGCVIAAGASAGEIDLSSDPYYAPRPGRRDGVYAVAGEEIQTFEAPEPRYAGAAGVPAEVVYRLPSPYVAVEATCEATLVKGDPGDRCRLFLSRDGRTWQPIFEMKGVGEEKVVLDLGRKARARGRPHVYTAYDFYLKAEFSSDRDPRSVGLKALKVVAHRELNMRTLPNLRPGENVLRLTADRIAPGLAVELEIAYRVDGTPFREKRTVRRFPHYFRIDVPGVRERVPADFSQDFNNGALRMEAVRMKLVRSPVESPSLPEAAAGPRFREACPHPADLRSPREVEAYETDVAQTSGFFPQSRRVSSDKQRRARLLKACASGQTVARWIALEDLGEYPEMVDFLCGELERANIDDAMFIIKALAQIGDPKAAGALLRYWNKGPPAWTPGSRYVPDALAVFGDRSVIPALVGRLGTCRFDIRFHVARALGILGGPEAVAALEDLARSDPFPAVREEARDALSKLRASR